MVTDPKRALSPPSPISPASADRNLLLGMIALQNNFITREALVAGFDVWVRSKSKTLAEILQSAGALSADDREILERLVCTFADRHGGDTQKMLASLSSAGPLPALAVPSDETSLTGTG